MNTNKYYWFSLVVAATVTILCLVAILDMTTKGIEIPERIWTILGGTLLFTLGLNLPPPNQTK